MQKSFPDITESQAQEIRNLAALFFTPKEIARMMEFPAADFVDLCEIEGTAIYNAFHAGRLQSEVDLRTGILKLAKSGSSPAQTMALDLLNKSKLKLFDR